MEQSQIFICCLSAFLFLCLPQSILATVKAPQNPSSAKECALCHYRWIDTFFLHNKGSELVPYQAEKVVAKAEICHSCHDGSVVDSRARVYNDNHHPINKPPPADMQIPKEFPLDENGFMQCATCHTAHALPDEMGIDKTIFIRASNENSGMCRQCHKDKDGGPTNGNHPIDSTSISFSYKLHQLGGVEGTKKNQVICESCHRVHGAPNDKFLIFDHVEGHLCLDCHKDKKGVVGTSHDLRFSAPASKNTKGQTITESGVCGGCHLVHGSKQVFLWSRKLDDSSKKNRARDLCISCHRLGGLAENKLLFGHSHPDNISMKGKKMNPELPVFDEEGRRVVGEVGILTCPTCHDSHKGRNAGSEKGTEDGEKFLRLATKPSPELCRQCHPAESRLAFTDHDLATAGSTLLNKRGQTPKESGPCGVCHLVHQSKSKDLFALGNDDQSSLTPEQLCLYCHNPEGAASTKVLGKRSHPVNMKPRGKGSTTTLPLYNDKIEKTKAGDITCLTCHNLHQWDPENEAVEHVAGNEGDGTNSFLRFRSAPSSILCANCHQSQSLIEKTDHDMNLTSPDSTNLLGQNPAKSGTCGACHLVHNGKARVRLWARKFGKGREIMDRMCTSCHNKKGIGSEKIVNVSSHPEGILITNIGRDREGKPNFFPLFQKKSGKRVRVGDISCASCHNAHQWDPKVEKGGPGKNIEGQATNSFLRMQTYSLMCIDCHGLDALFRFKYYHNSAKRGPVKN